MEIACQLHNEWHQLRVLWFQIRGDLDICATSPALVDYTQTLDGTAEALLIDVSGVTFLDCSGVYQLIGMLQTAQKTGCSVAIVTSGNRFVHRLTSLLALERILPLHKDFDSGMRALQPAPPLA
jgi:anti-anti-sigma factor